jgi:hypothetical protein
LSQPSFSCAFAGIEGIKLSDRDLEEMRQERGLSTAERALQGGEAVNMIRKGQVKRLDRSDAVGQAKFVESLFGVAK